MVSALLLGRLQDIEQSAPLVVVGVFGLHASFQLEENELDCLRHDHWCPCLGDRWLASRRRSRSKKRRCGGGRTDVTGMMSVTVPYQGLYTGNGEHEDKQDEKKKKKVENIFKNYDSGRRVVV